MSQISPLAPARFPDLPAIAGLEDTDLLDPRRIASAVDEADAFYEFLVDLFERIALRDELAGVAFDF